MKTKQSNGWIEWHGGECPVDDNQCVAVKLREPDEQCPDYICEAKFFRWGRRDVICSDDIVAYRVVNSSPINIESKRLFKTDNGIGVKHDSDKVRPDLIFNSMSMALMAAAEVSTFGAKKYEKDGWLQVPDGIKRYTAAMDRHRLLESQEDADVESGLKHQAHLAWNALARLELMLREEKVNG